jgi:hypothetical protein
VPDESSGRSAHADALWADTKIDPIEIALPGGVGYTLRGYRPASQLARPEVDEAAHAELDDFDAAAAAVARRRLAERAPDEQLDERPATRDRDRGIAGRRADLDDDLDHEDINDDDTGAGAKDDGDEDNGGEDNGGEELDELVEADDADAEEEHVEEEPVEDVPVFLSRRGRLLLFHSPDKLVEFVRSDAEHDLRQLESWSDMVAGIETGDVDPLSEDSYELDLVVENLRGGCDAWDLALILKAGEVARDIAFALRIEAIMTALSPGSPLDDLDDVLRTVDAGGVKSFFARRRMRKIPAQQSALAWRTIIGKISAVADWRD